MNIRNTPTFFENYFKSRGRIQRRIDLFAESINKTVLVVNEPQNLIYSTQPLLPGGYQGISFSDLLKGPRELNSSCMLVVTNNVMSKVASLGQGANYLRDQWDRSLFLCHDYDNHHWELMSRFCMEFCDFYFPAHPCGLGWIETHPSHTGHFIPCGTIQWSKARLKHLIEYEMSTDRLDEPTGHHHFYENFNFRNRIIKTLSETYPEVNFTNSESFHRLSEEEKLDSWIRHKIHIIIPVNGDVPIRFFDSLVTGGLPLVPLELVTSLKLFGIPKNFYKTYSINDVLKPEEIFQDAVRYFDNQGIDGMRERASYALSNFHVSEIVKTMVGIATHNN